MRTFTSWNGNSQPYNNSEFPMGFELTDSGSAINLEDQLRYEDQARTSYP